MVKGNINIITIDSQYAQNNQFNEILDCSPLYIAHLVAFSISSVYAKLQRKKDTKLSAVEFFAASLLDEQEYLSDSQIAIAETNGNLIKNTQEKIIHASRNSDKCVPIYFLSKLEDAILGHLPKQSLVEGENCREIIHHLNTLRKIATTSATESVSEVDWFYYHWIKRMRHLLAEEIIHKLLVEHRPYFSWIKKNDENTYLVTFSIKKLQERETKKHLRSMEGVLIEAYTRFNRRISRLYSHVLNHYKVQKLKSERVSFKNESVKIPVS